MNNIIQYLNTDLDLVSAEDLQPIGDAFTAAGACVLHVTRSEDSLYYATIEADVLTREPEASINALLTIIESFTPSLESQWSSCTKREFNIGYDCGDMPWAFNQGLSNALLARIAALGGALRITLYPNQRSKQHEASS